MFDNQLFEDWLNTQSTDAMKKITENQPVSANEMMVLVLKAQTNHIIHMEKDIHSEMVALRKDMDTRFKVVQKQMDTRFKAMQKQMDTRFKDMQEQMDKRFKQVDQRIDQLVSRMDTFMRWSFSLTILVGGLVVTAIQLLK